MPALSFLSSTLERAKPAVARTSTDRPYTVSFQSSRSLFPSRWRSDQDGRTQHVLAPLAEAGGGGGLWGARLGGVEPLVVGDPHVEVALGHGLGHAAREQPGLEGLARNLLETHRFAQHLGHDLRHVVIGEVLRAEHRATGDSAPGVIEQQTGSDSGDVAGGAAWLLEVSGDGQGKQALVL